MRLVKRYYGSNKKPFVLPLLPYPMRPYYFDIHDLYKIYKFVVYVGDQLEKEKHGKGFFVVAPGRSGRLLGMLVADEIKQRGLRRPKYFLLSLPFSLKTRGFGRNTEQILEEIDPHYKKVLYDLAQKEYVPVYVDAVEFDGLTRQYYNELLRKLGFNKVLNFVFSEWEQKNHGSRRTAEKINDMNSQFLLFRKNKEGSYVRKDLNQSRI